jgi:hypothetical protein
MDWTAKPRTVLAARPSRRKTRRLGPEGLRSLPREPGASFTVEPHRRQLRQGRSTSWRPETKRSSVDDPRTAVGQPAPVPPWSSLDTSSPTRRSRPTASGTIRPLPALTSVLADAGHPPLLAPVRTTTGHLAPRGTPLSGGRPQPWPVLSLARGSHPASSGATMRQAAPWRQPGRGRVLHCVPALSGVSVAASRRARTPAGDGPPPVKQGALTWLPSVPSPSVRTAATRAS